MSEQWINVEVSFTGFPGCSKVYCVGPFTGEHPTSEWSPEFWESLEVFNEDQDPDTDEVGAEIGVYEISDPEGTVVGPISGSELMEQVARDIASAMEAVE